MGATTGGAATVAALVTDDDGDGWPWLAEQPDPGDRVRGGCLLVLLVCALVWLLIVAGAVWLLPV